MRLPTPDEMNSNFRRLLGDATRLTRSGDLGAATRTIRRALSGGGGSPSAAARSTAEAPASPSGPPSPYADGSVLEGEWFRRDDPSPVEPHARPDVTRDVAAKATGDTRAEATRGTAANATRDTVADAGSGTRARARHEGGVSRARHEGRSGALDYRLFVPPLGLEAPPLLVMLHGCTQNADDIAVGTRMDALAREHGFLVLYPEQSGRANPQRCWNWFKHVHQRRGRGEPGLIEETLRTIVDAYGADPARVFVAGMSAGGAMASLLGDVCPGLFAGVGVHSGLAAGAARDMPGALAAMRGGQGAPLRSSATGPATRQPPTIVFHGDADPVVSSDNAERVVEFCLDGVRGSAPPPVPERDAGRSGGRRWSREVYRDVRGETLVERWLVHGAGHAWSGGDGRGSHTDPAGPDASAEMVRFFLARDTR